MNAGLLFRSIVHTRPKQLFRRARNVLRQRAHDIAPHRLPRGLEGPLPPREKAPPAPLFPPRGERVTVVDGEPQASFLNVVHDLRVPIDWKLGGAPDLRRMNVHYMEYLEVLDDDRFTRIVLDWIAENPLAAPGSWRIAWNSYALSLRTLVWMQQLATRGDRLEAGFRETACRSLVQQLRFLLRRLETDIGGNHLIKNAKTLLWASRFFAGEEAARWGAKAERILAAELAEQILPDGVHYERSPSYHLQVFADLLECANVATPELAAALQPALDAMARVAADLTHPDAGPSLFNDGGMHMTYATSDCLAAYEQVTTRDRPAARELFAFRDAGYFGARKGDSLVIADCGPIAPDHLPAHGHGDVLAFEWTAAGRRVIVDAGTFEYQPGALRDLERSTRVHNTVTLNRLDQAEFWSSFRVGRRPRVTLKRFEPTPGGFVLEGSHDGYRRLPGSPVHRRRFAVDSDTLSVDDTIDGGASQAAEARLLLHPDVVVTLTAGGGADLRCGAVTARLETPHAIRLEEVSWWPDFGVRRPTTMIVLTYGDAPCSGRFQLRREG